MRYEPDLAVVSLDEYRDFLKQQALLPSRQMLKDGTDGKFALIQAQGIMTVAQLLKVLSSPVKIGSFASQSGVDAKYLTVLKREIGTLKPKTVPLKSFPDTDAAQIEALAARGIKTSKGYFERGNQTGRLHAMCDLVRINGIGPNAAAMFAAAKYRSAAEIAASDAETMLARISAANADGRYYEGNLGLKDMQFCIDAASLLLWFSQ